MWSHWSRGALVTVLAVACCLGVAATVSGAARSTSKRADRATVALGPTRDFRRAAAERTLASGLRVTPSNGATDVAADAPIVVVAANGRLANVHVTSSSGAVVAGMLTPAGSRWQSIAPLGYATTYHVAVAATGSDLARVSLTSTFRTFTPATTVGATEFPSDGLSVGVGQPIVFRFDHYISSGAGQAAVLSHLHITMSQPVLGGWHWFSNNELHFRPQSYWPAKEQVTVSWNLDGWNAGNGMWGDGQNIVRFAVGDARVSFANLDTHLMTVTENGHVVVTYPISGGKATDPTMDGTHIVLDRSSVVRMNSATNGVPVNSPDGYDELVYSDVHISDSGEYVHAAPWSVSDQGRENVSHGCINLSPTDAALFFAFSRVGDVVIVTGSPRPPAVGDHGVMDWDTAWNDYSPANAILSAPASVSIAR
jgi:lipoprotein-anchoring transpeptidase ErfK/SrfK